MQTFYGNFRERWDTRKASFTAGGIASTTFCSACGRSSTSRLGRDDRQDRIDLVGDMLKRQCGGHVLKAQALQSSGVIPAQAEIQGYRSVDCPGFRGG
jgi:hypothetical protein